MEDNLSCCAVGVSTVTRFAPCKQEAEILPRDSRDVRMAVYEQRCRGSCMVWVLEAD